MHEAEVPVPRLLESVHHPTFAPEVEAIDQQHLQTIHKFLTDMNFGEENVDLTEIHLRPVFQPATTLGRALVFLKKMFRHVQDTPNHICEFIIFTLVNTRPYELFVKICRVQKK